VKGPDVNSHGIVITETYPGNLNSIEREEKKLKLRNDAIAEIIDAANIVANTSSKLRADDDFSTQALRVSIEDEKAISDLEEITRPRTSNSSRQRRRHHRSRRARSMVANSNTWVVNPSSASSMDESSMDECSVPPKTSNDSYSVSIIGNNEQSNLHGQDQIDGFNLDRDRELERRRLRKERRKRQKARQKREEKKYSIVDNQATEEDGDYGEQQVLPATMISNFFENS